MCLLIVFRKGLGTFVSSSAVEYEVLKSTF